jgi:hypothetical protein
LACKKFIRLRNDKLCRFGHGTFRVSGSCCILVNCFSLLIYPKNGPFANIFFTDSGNTHKKQVK